MAPTAKQQAAIDYQQEVDVLRGNVAELAFNGVWTAKNPPAVAGAYGVFLQDLNAGVSLDEAFNIIVNASAASQHTAYATLVIVQARIRLLRQPRKRTG